MVCLWKKLQYWHYSWEMVRILITSSIQKIFFDVPFRFLIHIEIFSKKAIKCSYQMHKKWFFSNSLQRYTVTNNTIFVCTKCIIFITTTGNVQLWTRFVTYIVPFVCKSLKLFIECLTFGNILVPYTIVKITIFWSNNYVYIFKIIIQDRDSNGINATYSEMIHNHSNKKMNTLISLVLLTTLNRFIDICHLTRWTSNYEKLIKMILGLKCTKENW